MVASSTEFKELESYAKGYVENNRNNNRDNDLGTSINYSVIYCSREPSEQISDRGTMIVPFLQMRKIELREDKFFLQVTQLWSWVVDPGLVQLPSLTSCVLLGTLSSLCPLLLVLPRS